MNDIHFNKEKKKINSKHCKPIVYSSYTSNNWLGFAGRNENEQKPSKQTNNNNNQKRNNEKQRKTYRI